MHIPIVLPDGWTVDEASSYGTVINACDGQGAVTVNEKMRGFSLGNSPVRKKGGFDGRKWKVALYEAAVDALQKDLALWRCRSHELRSTSAYDKV